jgi:copper transport protein
VALAVALGLPAAIGPPAARAHARPVRATPPDGAALGGAPRQVRIEFSEAISSRFRTARLIDSRGRVVGGTVVRSSPDPARLVVDVPRLRRGTYQLAWEVLAEGDGHVTGGSTVFGVAMRPGAHGRSGLAAGATVAPLVAWLGWLDVVVFCLLTGTLLMAALLARLDDARAPLRTNLGVAAGAAAAAALLGIVLLAQQLHRLAGVGVSDLLGIRWGHLWLAREGLLLGLTGCALYLRRTRSPRTALLAGGLLLGLVAVRALGSHAAAGPQAGLNVPVAAVHMLAAAVWIGGVAAFALALASARGGAAALARRCAGPFGKAAGAALAALLVTGLLAAGAQVASVDALLTTDYGRTLFVKTGLVAIAAGLGLVNALLLRRGAQPRVIRAEAATGLGVLLAASVLAASPPAKGPEFGAPRPSAPATFASQSGDLLVTTTVRPNRPGANVVTVLTASSKRPAPASVRRAALRLEAIGGGSRQTLALGPIGSGKFTGAVQLPTDGRWRASLTVERGGRSTRFATHWLLSPPDPARPVVHSARRLAPLVDLAAAMAVLAMALAAAFRWARQRPRTIRLARIPLP